MQMPLPLESAQARGTRGIERAADRVERIAPGWIENAVIRVREHIRGLPFDRDFIIEDVRLAVQPSLPVVPELRVWGAVTRLCIQRGLVVNTGRFMPARSSHGCPKAVYRRGVAA